MQIPKINSTPAPTRAETFFVERCIELLSDVSIDSYRLPLHNPKTILKELVAAIQGYNAEELTNEEYLTMISDEALSLFKHETFLTFSKVSLIYLKTTMKDKNKKNEMFYASSILIEENKNYVQSLFQNIQIKITELNALGSYTPTTYLPFDCLIVYFLIELREIGYSKRFLHRFIAAVNFTSANGTFANRLNILGGLLTKPKESYTVIISFNLKPTIEEQLEILDPTLVPLESKEIKEIGLATNRKVKDFFFANQQNKFYKTVIECPDYYSASHSVRRNLQGTLDILFMGYSGEEFSINSKCVVIGENSPRQASVQNLDFQLEGHFKSDQELYREFSERVTALKAKEISPDAVAKIDSSLRYLRLGSMAQEIENKLLNYWIGMEYFFSSSDARKSKTKRMREFYKKLDGKIYFKRILIDFHRSIKLFGLEASVANYNDDLQYLKDQANFASIEVNTASPSLSLRAYILREILFKKSEIAADLKRHAERIDWNILRIYRIRNSVVHSANSNLNVVDITSHLRYYLIFVINFAIDYFNNSPYDINMDGKINLDDFFLVNQAEFDNLIIAETTDVGKLLEFNNPIEFIS